MRYRFQYLNVQGEWEDLGDGEGSGDTPILDAFNDLAAERGDMPAGEYRYAPQAADWGFLTLDNEGNIDLGSGP